MDAECQCGLGNCYYFGFGTNRDYKKAFKWYSKSANSECSEGQCCLGNCYYYGFGTNRDYKKHLSGILNLLIADVLKVNVV